MLHGAFNNQAVNQILLITNMGQHYYYVIHS